MFEETRLKCKSLLRVTSYWLLVAILSGCVVRTYKLTKERVDQDLAGGNRGYLEGQVPQAQEAKTKKPTRTIQAVEIELHPLIKFEKTPKEKPEERPAEKVSLAEKTEYLSVGNRGYITRSATAKVVKPEAIETELKMKKYTVKEGDTLQKISKEFYGTTKKWTKIYEANKDALRAADKIYPGQVINIPVEPLKEPSENLK